MVEETVTRGIEDPEGYHKAMDAKKMGARARDASAERETRALKNNLEGKKLRHAAHSGSVQFEDKKARKAIATRFGPALVKYCADRDKQTVRRGECWDLLQLALKDVGARGPDNGHRCTAPPCVEPANDCRHDGRL